MPNDIVDVLIIGAGASGAAVAWGLADTRMRIVCLEQGDWMNPSNYPSNFQDWEVHGGETTAASPNFRSRDADYPIDDSDSPIAILNFNAVGGSTILYSAHFPRFHPSDFRVRSLDGVGDDWPIDYFDLEPFFAQNDRNMGVSGLRGDPAIPDHSPPLPHIPLGKMGEAMGRGFNRLGWHWWPSDSAIITEPYEGRGQCLNLGPCNTGCAQGAKSSVDIAYWPVVQRMGVELRTNCRVSHITVDDNDMATGAVYWDADGVEQHQPAEMVIMACNGVGTPRLLLNSKSSQFPEGLANRSGLVGKNLMLHPWGHASGLFAEPLESHFGPQGCCILSQQFYETDLSRGFVRGYNLQITRGSPPVSTARMGMATGSIPWGAGHHDGFERLYDRTVHVGVCAEDLPEEHNRVVLDDELKDSNGVPAPRIEYRASENSLNMLAHGTDRAAEALEAAGAIEVNKSSFPMRMAGWHLLGTARMGSDPNRSVVNEWGRSHDVRNLFIVDGSVFVTSGGVNPTTTIQAVALYIADSIKNRLATLFD